MRGRARAQGFPSRAYGLGNARGTASSGGSTTSLSGPPLTKGVQVTEVRPAMLCVPGGRPVRASGTRTRYRPS
jgi:hypothetical protein